jgi:hypothetical protein
MQKPLVGAINAMNLKLKSIKKKIGTQEVQSLLINREFIHMKF